MKRAKLSNPNFYCSFNSLTQCLYNLKLFRNMLLNCNFDQISEQPFVFRDPVILENENNLDRKIATKIYFSKSALNFGKEYQKIFKEMKDSSKVLCLDACIKNLVTNGGEQLLKDGPSDPFLEFLTVIALLSDSDKPFFLNLLVPFNNKFIKLFSFLMSEKFQKSERALFFAGRGQFSIFGIPLEEMFFNFKKKDSNSKQFVLHSLPDILALNLEYSEINPATAKIQKTIDFSEYVFDKSKSNIFRLNSFIMMLYSLHVVAYIRDMDTADTSKEKWLLCNDLQIRELGELELEQELQFYSKEKYPTVAFYERKMV